MLRKTIISLLVVFFILGNVVTFAAQYENYEWGTSKQDAIDQVKEEGHDIVKQLDFFEDGQEGIVYTDEIFNKTIQVRLLFTPKSKRLWGVRIISRNSSLGKELKASLNEEYGEFEQPEENVDKYRWIENGVPTILLEYDDITSLIYNSDKFYQIYEEEKQELEEKDEEDKV